MRGSQPSAWRQWMACGICLAVLLGGGVAFGQAPPDPTAAAPAGFPPAAGPAMPGVPTLGSGVVLNNTTPLPPVIRYAHLPTDFLRGNSGVVGFYFSLFKLVLLIGFFFGWVHYSTWVFDDSGSLKVRPLLWNSAMLGGGVAAMALFLVMPAFAFGLIAAALAGGLPLGLYINERNQRVPDAAKVMTPAHIKKWTKRQLARIGINFGAGRAMESVAGPPISFVGKSKTGQRDDARTRSVENSKGFLAAKEVVYDAIMRRATDIHLEPKEDELGARLRIDGVMYPTEPFDRGIGDALINIFKVLSAMDITEKRKPQDGSFSAILEDREIDFRVATQGTRFGEKMSMRILDQSNSVKSLEQLGMRKQLVEQIDKIINEPHGLFMSCGPTGAGKSTTLYAALSSIDSNENNIITVEDPVEYKMENVTQIEINQKAGQTFAGSLRSILRQDPDIVMIGEIRDEETAKICCQAANTGHMVFSTVHANDTITALFRIIDLGVEPFMLSTAVSGILGQRLARRLCPHCRVAYKPNPEVLKQVGLSAEKVKEFYKPPTEGKGEKCTHCNGMGYRGRIGVFELLVINDRLRDLIREKAPMTAIKAEARKNGMLSMSEEGIRLVVRGVTSIDEVARVVK
ncbi:GspE/PulE family protein [Planctomyces sp. SH-PL14]|uniref:GspE/PulE family protein n=1 Tax=Planctomyces sp. SH-PL14 TaxID=1632864 RepID=UPI001E46B881|nr:GspE/PulE family protein [Planctomyces sp. SH-PL14]